MIYTLYSANYNAVCDPFLLWICYTYFVAAMWIGIIDDDI